MEGLKLLKGMAQDTRLEILRLLYTRGEMYVVEIQSFLEIPYKKTLHHLHILRDLAMVGSVSVGSMRYYSIVSEECLEILRIILPEEAEFDGSIRSPWYQLHLLTTERGGDYEEQ